MLANTRLLFFFYFSDLTATFRVAGSGMEGGYCGPTILMVALSPTDLLLGLCVWHLLVFFVGCSLIRPMVDTGSAKNRSFN